jgi:hypothetical protein
MCCIWTRSRWRGSTCDEIRTTVASGKNSANGIRHTTLGTGGCGVFENPSLDSRGAAPRWLPSPPSVVSLTEGDDAASGAGFSLWKIAGQKTLFHDGRHLHLTNHLNHQTLRLSLTGEIRDGGAVAFVVPVSIEVRESWPAISHITELLTSDRRSPKRATTHRPSRQAILHMRSLQALDGESSGASHRDIASAIFGRTDVWQRWATNSELRAQIRYLLRRGHDLVNGGYRGLLTNPRFGRGEGELPTGSDSP